MTVGWIKLHRKFLKWEWYDDQNVFRLFMHLLLTANYETSKYRGYKVDPGQVIIGFHVLSERTGLSISQIRTALNKLKSTEEITIKTTNKFSIVTIACWDEYQASDKQIANQSQTDDKPIATSKEGKKKRKKEVGTRIDPDWKPNEENTRYAVDKGFSNGRLPGLVEGFVDYYIAATGKGSTALNWDAKWRTWVRNDIKFNGEPASKRELF